MSAPGGVGKPRASPNHDEDEPIDLDAMVEAIMALKKRGKKPTQRTVAEELGRNASSVNRALHRMWLEGDSWSMLVAAAPLLALMRVSLEKVLIDQVERRRENEATRRDLAEVAADRAGTRREREAAEAAAKRAESAKEYASASAAVRAREVIEEGVERLQAAGEEIRSGVENEGLKQRGQLVQVGKVMLEGAAPALARKLAEVDLNNAGLKTQIAREEEARTTRDEAEVVARRHRDDEEALERRRRNEAASSSSAASEEEAAKARRVAGAAVEHLERVEDRVERQDELITSQTERIKVLEKAAIELNRRNERLDQERAANQRAENEKELERIRNEWKLLCQNTILSGRVRDQELRTQLSRLEGNFSTEYDKLRKQVESLATVNAALVAETEEQKIALQAVGIDLQVKGKQLGATLAKLLEVLQNMYATFLEVLAVEVELAPTLEERARRAKVRVTLIDRYGAQIARLLAVFRELRGDEEG